MKKLMIGLVGAVALCASAQAEVESENIVGYTTADVANGKFAMVGVQYSAVGNGAVSIQDFIKGDFAGVPYDDDNVFLNTAPQIQVLNADGLGYTIYYYLTDAWIEDDGTGNEAFVPGWADGAGVFSTSTFKPGESVWFKATTGDCVINTSGQVFTLGTITKTCANGKFTMVANSKPIALDLNDSTQVTYSGIVGVPYDDDNVFLNTAPQIQVLNADGLGYTIYYYLTDAWIEDDGTGNEAFVPGWADGAGVYVTEAIPVGKGFWVKATTGEFSINFVQ